MPTQRQQDEARDHVMLRLIPLVRPSANDWQPANIVTFRSRTHQLRHFCVRTGFERDILDVIDSLLILSAEFWQLLLDDTANQGSKAEYRRVRTLGAEAEGLGNMEELLSGEDTLRDILINSVAFALNWKSNTIWINEAVKERTGIVQTGLATLQDHIWRLLDARTETDSELELAQVSEMGHNLEQLWQLMDSLPLEVQMQLLRDIYGQLIRLELRQLLTDLS